MNQISFACLLALSVPFGLSGQTVKMINSTEQSWSGGIAGRSGTNYTFVVEFSDYAEMPLPDTLWIGEEPFKLMYGDLYDAGNINTKCTVTKKTARYSFNASITHDEYANRFAPPPPDNKPKAPPAHRPVTYRGVGLLSYKYEGKDHYYTISKIMTVLEPANYP